MTVGFFILRFLKFFAITTLVAIALTLPAFGMSYVYNGIARKNDALDTVDPFIVAAITFSGFEIFALLTAFILQFVM